eukprot:3303961-Rhodomonas_salina.1
MASSSCGSTTTFSWLYEELRHFPRVKPVLHQRPFFLLLRCAGLGKRKASHRYGQRHLLNDFRRGVPSWDSTWAARHLPSCEKGSLYSARTNVSSPATSATTQRLKKTLS